MSCGRGEPAGLPGPGKQVTEVKEGPMELRRKRRYMHGGGEGERLWRASEGAA